MHGNHLHYSPFQAATSLEVATYHVNAEKVVKTLEGLTKKDRLASKNMGCTLPVEQAARIPGSPTAFISPNGIDSMRDIKMPMAAQGLYSASKASNLVPAYDHSYRNRMRQGYGDRDLQEKLIQSGASIA